MSTYRKPGHARMTSTLTEKAVAGRRVQFAYHSSLHGDSATLYTPGIITGTEPGLSGALRARIRLDGERSNLSIAVDYEGIRYLDEVVPVPELPMGRFHPTADDLGWDWEGVPACSLESEDIILLTHDQDRAEAALREFCKDMWIDPEYLPAMQSRWAVFEWEPEDADIPWTIRWDAAEGDDQALRIYYLPA
jgi:hypothetical protein